MTKNYETPSIEIVEYEIDILTANTSAIFDFPWFDKDKDDNDFFA